MAVTIGLEWPGYGYEKGSKYHTQRFKRGMLRVDEYGKLFGAKTRKPSVKDLNKNKFIKGQFTYQGSDTKANRGVKIYFHLFPGILYEICYWDGYKKKIKYKCKIENGRICRKNI